MLMIQHAPTPLPRLTDLHPRLEPRHIPPRRTTTPTKRPRTPDARAHLHPRPHHPPTNRTSARHGPRRRRPRPQAMAPHGRLAGPLQPDHQIAQEERVPRVAVLGEQAVRPLEAEQIQHERAQRRRVADALVQQGRVRRRGDRVRALGQLGHRVDDGVAERFDR